MQIDAQHWLTEVQKIPSPFYNQRPNGLDGKDINISLLVIHHISLPPREYGGPYVEQLFTGKLDSNAHPFFASIAHLEVSAHCFIRRDGQIIQFVAFDKRAWHAGQSSFAGQENCNDYAIGIEMEGSEFDTYTNEQYQSLAQVTRVLLERYPKIDLNRITGHQYIAPLRKSDPGLTFNWSFFKDLISKSS